ncbi:MAG TPA: DUF2950 domain-containing protein [Candidatus Polarisedimenticolaceae bacterium]|nr:DUF2950 domain-containing protein [Candidatus Polarisedimenticolaceae bacterium]
MRTLTVVALAFLVAAAALAAPGATTAPAPVKQRSFPTAQAAADALVTAAEKDDVPALMEILGPEGKDLVGSGDAVMDKNQAAEFAKQARVKLGITPDPKNASRATIVIGEQDWPMPIPVVKQASGWRFDTVAGKKEILYRRVGRNELDAIEVCRGYVEAQEEYASEPRGGSKVVQYAQRVVGTADKEDGLAWRDPDGTWRGPIGEKIAQAIEEGYSSKTEPYHGYFFKILKGQGKHAPLGTLDYVVKGIMIGGFALVAAPAEHAVTGVKSFIVSQDGVVYEKDLGPKTLDAFKAMDRFDPDPSWKVVPDDADTKAP